MRSNPNGLQTIAFLIYEVAWNSGSLGEAQVEVAKIHHHKTIDKIKIERASNVMYVLGTLGSTLLAVSPLILNTPILQMRTLIRERISFPQSRQLPNGQN